VQLKTTSDGQDGKQDQGENSDPIRMWPALINLINSHADYWRAQTKKANEPEPYNIGFWTKVTAIGTCVGALLAFAAAAAIWEQFGAMVDASNASEAAFNTDQRAWLGFIGFDVKDNIEAGKVLSAHTTILNSGKSPAIHVQVMGTVQTICGGFPKVPSYPRVDPDNISTSLVMPNAPRATAESTAARPLTVDDIAIANRNDCEIYGYARATYSDTLSKRPHWRHMCVQWVKGTPRSFVDCGTYNDGDEDYPDGKEPK
jgi:hypothetical protein